MGTGVGIVVVVSGKGVCGAGFYWLLELGDVNIFKGLREGAAEHHRRERGVAG